MPGEAAAHGAAPTPPLADSVRRPYPYRWATLSGLLYGLSFPSFAQVHLEPLAWCCWVPWLLALRGPVSWGQAAASGWLALWIGTAIATRWLLVVEPGVGLFVFTVQSALMLPILLLFFAGRRLVGWRHALWILPPLWTGWEWLLTRQPLHTPLAFFGYSQANWYGLIQYCDLVGVWGVACWLVLFNVLIARAWALAAEGGRGMLRRLLPRLVVIALPMLALPAGYGWYRIGEVETRLAQAPRITIALVQPNVGYGGKEQESQRDYVKTMEQMVIRSTDSIIAHRPDLVVWPEATLPFDVNTQAAVRDYLLLVVERWNVPLILGFQERLDERHLYNSALLVTPQLARYARGLPRDQAPRLKVYRKQELVPFAEQVPFADRVPALEALALPIDGATSLILKGDPVATRFAFRDRQGVKRWAGVRICYEVLYPAGTARLVADGAAVLIVISNDGPFGRSTETLQLAAYSRILAISTRRSLARCANTGLTLFADPLGRLYGSVPRWEEQVAVGSVALGNDLSLYVRYPDLFPAACLGAAVLGALLAWVRMGRAARAS